MLFCFQLLQLSKEILFFFQNISLKKWQLIRTLIDHLEKCFSLFLFVLTSFCFINIDFLEFTKIDEFSILVNCLNLWLSVIFWIFEFLNSLTYVNILQFVNFWIGFLSKRNDSLNFLNFLVFVNFLELILWISDFFSICGNFSKKRKTWIFWTFFLSKRNDSLNFLNFLGFLNFPNFSEFFEISPKKGKPEFSEFFSFQNEMTAWIFWIF